MKKVSYISPFILSFSIMISQPFAVSGGDWDNSIKDAGSNWGGTDTDDSLYGL